MSQLRSENEQPVHSQDGEAYQPPCLKELEVAGGTTEAASMVIPPSSN